ncbi:MAG: signal peptidase II [Rubrobacter sp.]|nr:signal peptidase II [Rubrobacter sp.]
MTDPVYTPPKRRRRAKGTSVVLPALALAVLVYVVDQGIKLLVENTMAVGESIPLVGNSLSLTYILNDGGAFGIFSGSQIFLMAGSAVAVIVVVWMLLAGPPSKLTTIGCGLILGGAAGNLHDRITSGEVTDYVHFSFWYIFNAADAAIVVGVGMLLISSLFPPKDRG